MVRPASPTRPTELFAAPTPKGHNSAAGQPNITGCGALARKRADFVAACARQIRRARLALDEVERWLACRGRGAHDMPGDALLERLEDAVTVLYDAAIMAGPPL
jgi:hypothetical protein